MDMKKMMKQAQKMQIEIARAQEEIKEMTFTATAGGGVVEVVAKGDTTIESISIDPSAVDPEDVEMLQDMVLVAVNEALRGVAEMGERRLSLLINKEIHSSGSTEYMVLSLAKGAYEWCGHEWVL